MSFYNFTNDQNQIYIHPSTKNISYVRMITKKIYKKFFAIQVGIIRLKIIEFVLKIFYVKSLKVKKYFFNIL